MAGHLGTIWASVALDTAPLGAGAARARREMYALDATMNQTAGKSSASAGGIGKALLGVGSAATIMGGVVAMASYKMASEFDDAMHRVWSVSDDSRVAMEAWGSEILDLSTRFPESAKSMAEALYWIKSDMPDASDAEQFATLETALKGATGGVAELKDATEALIVVQNAYAGSGVELQGPTDYMDAMNMAVKRGSVTLQDFVANMGKAVGTAAMAKVPFTEIAAAAATLTKKGVPVETTFMALNQAMMTFLKPSKEASDLAQKLGIDFTLAGLRSKGLAGALMEIADKVPDDELANLFPNIRALKAVLPLAGVSVADFAKDLDEMGKRSSTTESMFKKNMDSMQNKTKVWFNAVKKPLIEFGTSLFPTVTKIGDAIARMFEGKNATANMFFGGLKSGISVITSLTKAAWDFKGVLLTVAAGFAAFKIGSWVKGLASAGGIVSNVMAGLKGNLAGVTGFSGKVAQAFRYMHTSGLDAAYTMTGLSGTLGAFGLAAGAAVAVGIGIYAMYRRWDEAAEKARLTVIKTDRDMGKQGATLATLSGKYQDLRDKLAGMTPEMEGYAETERQVKDAKAALVSAFPEMISGYNSEREAILASDAAIKEHINNLLKYSGIRTLKTTGEAAGLEATIKTMDDLTAKRATIAQGIDDIAASMEKLNINGFDSSTVIRLLSTDFKKGAAYVKDYMQMQQEAGQIAKDAWARDPYHAINEINDAVKQLGITVQGTGGSLQYIDKQLSQLAIDAADAKNALVQAAYQAGLAGEGISRNIGMALASTSPEFRQFGADATAGMAAAMLAMRGVTEGGAELAQHIAQLIATGADWDGTGGEVGKEVYDAIKQQLADLGIEIKPTVDERDVDAAKTRAHQGWTASLVPDVDESQITAAKTRAHQGWTASLVPDVDESQITAAKTRARQGWSATLVPNVDESLITAAKTRAHQGWTATMTVNTQTSVNPMFDHPYDAGLYMGEQISKGAGAAAPSIALGTSLEKAWATMNATALPTWSTARLAPGGDMSIEDWEHINEAIANLGGNVAANLTGWWGMNGALIEAEKSLKKYTAASEKAEERLDALQVKQTALNESLNKHKERLSELSQMKLKGEGKADDKSFAQTQAINKLELERLKIQQRARAGTATEADYNRLFVIAQKKQELELQQQIGDLQTSITYDPQRRQIEKLLDPLKGQEMTQKAITKAIKAEQKAIAEKERQLVKVEKQIKKEQAEVKRLRKAYDAAYKVVTDYSHKIDEMARNFLDHYQKMIAAQEELNRQMAGGSMGSAIPQYASGGPVVQDGLIYAHAGEYVLSRAAVRSFASLPRMNVSSVTQSSMTVFNFENLVLPNVTDAPSLIGELRNVNLRAQVS